VISVDEPSLDSGAATKPWAAGKLTQSGKGGGVSGRSTSRWTANVWFCVLAAVIATVRFAILIRNGEPSGLDFGNWLTIGHHWLGTGAPNGSTSTYPPVVPLLAVAAVAVFGLSVGTALLATVAALMPALAVYTITVNRSARLTPVLLGAVIGAAGSTGEATAWGGVPQLLGLGFGLWTLHAFVGFLRNRRRRDAWNCGLLLTATGATTHLLLAQVVTCMVAVVVLRVASREGRRCRPLLGRDGLAAHALRIIVPMLPLVPLYLQLSGSVGVSFVSRTRAASSISRVLDGFGGIFNDAPMLWKTALVVALLVPIVCVRRREDPLWLLTSSILYTVVASVAFTGESRFAYFAPLGIATGLALLASEVRDALPHRARLVGALCVCAVSVVAVSAGLKHFSSQREYYGERLVPSGTTAALEWVRSHTPANALIAVPPVDAVPFGWWVEGFGHRATLTGSLDIYLNFPRERDRARQSIALFGLTDVSAGSFAAQARSLGVDYLYVPAGWGGLAESSLQRFINANPSSVVFKSPAAIVVRVTA
jgi:hypothetical protein